MKRTLWVIFSLIAKSWYNNCFDLQGIFLFSLIKYKSVAYEGRKYPSWAEGLGWSIACCSMLCIPITAIRVLMTAEGSFFEVSVATVWILYIWLFKVTLPKSGVAHNIVYDETMNIWKTYSFIHLDHLTGYNKPSKWSAASWLVSSIGRMLRWYRGGSCTFRKRSLLFFELLLSVSIKKKENHDPGSNPDLSYPNLSPLPLHYHIDPLKFRKTLSTYTSKLFFLCYINNRWPYPFP